MRQKTLGKTGISIPEIGFGTWGYHGGTEPLKAGFGAGAVFVDTAESYESEEVVGEAIAGIRDRIFLATKVSASNLRHQGVIKAAEGSLKRLGTTHIDLYQIHQPNPEIPIEETLGAMEQLVDEGKIRFIGVSNFNQEQLAQARAAFRKHPIVSNQVRYNLADRTIESGLLQYCQQNGITVIAYSPLARELHRLSDCDPKGVLTKIANETGHSIAQIALNWCLCKEGVVVIPKGNSVDHVLDNCGASDWRLSEEQIRLIDSTIQFRRRSQFDTLIRKLIPSSLAPVAKRCLDLLPRSIRRRLN